MPGGQNKIMTKPIRTFLACLGAAVILTVSAAADTCAAGLVDPIRIWGPVTKADSGGEDVKFFFMNNLSGQSHSGEIQITVSNVYTRVLDAATGLPYPYEEIKEGATVYVYIGPALSANRVSMANASLVLCNIPAGYKVPDYTKVDQLTWSEDKTMATLLTTNGAQYTVPAACENVPYLSRNIVTIDDLTPGSSILIWSDNQNTASKIINFSCPGIAPEELSAKSGWQEAGGNWYYYKEDGAMAFGWTTIAGRRYYLNPYTGIMHTGFLTIDGNTYYFQPDGKLLTTPQVFIPDESGILRPQGHE